MKADRLKTDKKNTNKWKAGGLLLCAVIFTVMAFSMRPAEKMHASTAIIPSPSASEARKETIEMQSSAHRQMLAERSKAEAENKKAEEARESDIKKAETSQAQQPAQPAQAARPGKVISQPAQAAKLSTTISRPTQDSKPGKFISQPTATYSYDSMDRTMYATISLSVRSHPEKSGSRIGTLSNGASVHVTGRCQQTGWYRIDYNGRTGYVSDRYISDNKPQPQSSPVSNINRTARTANTSGIRYSWTSHGSTQRDVDNGYMIQYTENYFAADIRTSMGKQIRSLRKGDIVSINGRKVMIDGEVYDNYNTGTVEGGRKKIEAKGYDYNSVCFQTCIPPYHGPIVIKFGHYV